MPVHLVSAWTSQPPLLPSEAQHMHAEIVLRTQAVGIWPLRCNDMSPYRAKHPIKKVERIMEKDNRSSCLPDDRIKKPDEPSTKNVRWFPHT
jgi:hypothetical protein